MRVTIQVVTCSTSESSFVVPRATDTICSMVIWPVLESAAENDTPPTVHSNAPACFPVPRRWIDESPMTTSARYIQVNDKLKNVNNKISFFFLIHETKIEYSIRTCIYIYIYVQWIINDCLRMMDGWMVGWDWILFLGQERDIFNAQYEFMN